MTTGLLPRETLDKWEGRDPISNPVKSQPASPTDLRSTSTVTATESSTSERNSRDGQSFAASSSAFDDSPVTPGPHPWPIDEYDLDEQPSDEHLERGVRSLTSLQPVSKGLPRCGLVNFRKDGDSLRWAPCVTKNTGGLAARVHNFEDAFSLEEFSSKALPMLWKSTGGNPRPSQAEDDKSKTALGETVGGRSKRSYSTGDSCVTAESKLSGVSERSSKSLSSASQKSITKSSSFKRSVALAGEMRRPSFWSMLAHNVKSHRHNGRKLIEKNGIEQNDSVQAGCAVQQKTAATKSPWDAVVGLKFSVSPSGTSKAKEKKRAQPSARNRKLSLLRKLFEPFSKSKSKPKEDSCDKGEDECAIQKPEPISAGPEEKVPLPERMRRKHKGPGQGRSALGPTHSSSGNYVGRRVRSSMCSPVNRKRDNEDERPVVLDDQYVTFMTSVV